MTRSQKAQRKRTANILGAFALALTDKVAAAVSATGQSNDLASAALVQIGFETGMSIERLRSCLSLSHSATVRLIDGLQAKNLVSRTRNPALDSRVAALSLTPGGRAAMRETLAARATIVDDIVSELSDEELALLTRVLEKSFPRIVAPGADEDVVCRLCDLDTCPQDKCPVTCRDTLAPSSNHSGA